MRFSRNTNWASAVLLCMFGAVAFVGCKASVEMSAGTETPPPPPPPPPPDDDGDGILNPDDKCPQEAEDKAEPNPTDGCPNLDQDNDGVPLPADKCPDKAETKNDYQDDDGCPDEKPIAEVKGNTIQINKEIRFKKGSAEIEGDSMGVVDAVAKIITENPQIQLVEIEGHASKEGDEALNKTLTGQRVKAVQGALVAKKVEAARLTSVGYGFYCLKNEGTDEAAHAQNRRVEFKIVYLDGKRTEEKLGCDAADKKGIKATIPAKPPWAGTGAATSAPAATGTPAVSGGPGGVRSTGK